MVEFNRTFKKEEKVEEKKKEISYTNVRGRKVLNAAGIALKEVNKVITPVNEEELALCKYFEGIGFLKLNK